jgi:hypothetical protein
VTKGFDVSNPLTRSKAAEFFADGYKFVVRYLSPASWKSWKALTADEAQMLSEIGLQIMSVWETTAGAAGEGTKSGRDAGIFALQAAKEVGQPEGSKIYFAVDFEPQTSQYAAIADYFIAAGKEIPGYVLDAYGCKAIIDYLQSRGIITNGWQTLAWSHGQRNPHISVYQSAIDIPIHGIQADSDESYGNEGWWNTLGIQAMTADDANKVIAFLKAAYGTTGDAEAHIEIKRLANEMRRVSEQPTQ